MNLPGAKGIRWDDAGSGPDTGGLPGIRTVTSDLTGIDIDPQCLYHLDPRSGKAVASGVVAKQKRMRFTPPSRGPGFDWVLVLDEAGRGFGAPGAGP